MKLTAEREKLLGPLQAVIGVVERRQTMPVLANVLLGVRSGSAVDHGDRSRGRVGGRDRSNGSASRRHYGSRPEIPRYSAGLTGESRPVAMTLEGEKVVIKAGRSRFSLSPCRPRNFR